LEEFGYVIQRSEANMKCFSLWTGILLCTSDSAYSKVVKLSLVSQTQRKVRTIPTEIGLLEDLIELELTGLRNVVLPSEIASLQNLKKIRLFNTDFGQPLPRSIAEMDVDCLIESDGKTERETCTSCLPLGNCLVHPGDDCSDLCYFTSGNQTAEDLIGSEYDARSNPQFENLYGQILRQRKTGVDYPKETLLGTSTSEMANTTRQTTSENPQTQNQTLTIDRDEVVDYTIVYIVAICCVAFVLAVISLAVIYFFFIKDKRELDDPLEYHLKHSDTNYTFAPQPDGQKYDNYGKSSFANLP